LRIGIAGERSRRNFIAAHGRPQASHLEGEAILKGLGETEEDRGQVFTFFREPAEGATLDPELEVLKKGLRHMLSEGNVQPPDWEDREAARVVG
jgi:hypothetical protein